MNFNTMALIDTEELVSNSTVSEQLHSVYELPTLFDYYENLSPFIIISMFAAVVLFILNFSIFYATTVQLRQRLNKPLLNITIALCSAYPVICLAAIATIFIPKSWLFCHTIMHLCFTICGILFQRLCMNYVDSESTLIKLIDGNPIMINTPPLCCCCLCLPKIVPSKTKFLILKYFIWQMPFIQGAVMFVLNGIYYTEPEFYNAVYKYFMPFIISSILLGLWGLNVTVRMVMKLHADYGMMKKMFCIQLILLLCKLQYLLLDKQLDTITLGGSYPINHIIFKQTLINLLILVEMVLVSLLAQTAYKFPVQDIPKQNA